MGRYLEMAKEVLKEKDRQNERNPHMPLEDTPPVPYIDHTGTLVIPFDSDPKYHWWRGGQSVEATLKELGASQEIMKRYLYKP